MNLTGSNFLEAGSLRVASTMGPFPTPILTLWLWLRGLSNVCTEIATRRDELNQASQVAARSEIPGTGHGCVNRAGARADRGSETQRYLIYYIDSFCY